LPTEELPEYRVAEQLQTGTMLSRHSQGTIPEGNYASSISIANYPFYLRLSLKQIG